MNNCTNIFRVFSRSEIVATFLSAAVLVFATGCNKHTPQSEQNQWIGFNGEPQQIEGQIVRQASSDEIARTKAAAYTEKLITTKENLRSKSFGVFGYKSIDDQNLFTPVFGSSKAQEVKWAWDNFSEDYEYERPTPRECWTYSPKQKWERAMYYRFRAIWPYETEIQPNSSANLVSTEYSSSTDDYDLMVAYATRRPITEGVGRVTLEFKHALAGLRFKLKFNENSDEKPDDELTEFYITGIYPQGQLFYGITETVSDVNAIRWIMSDNTFDDRNPQFQWTGSAAFGGADNKAANIYFSETPAGTTGETITDGAALIIPQQLSSPIGDTYVNFRTKLGSTVLHRAKLPTEALESGKIYTYTLKMYGTEINVSVDIQDWTEIQSNIDIKL